MACFLKLASSGEKGIITFTTSEWYQSISKSTSLKGTLESVKNNWSFGLHHNTASADHHFKPSSFFDFHLAGPGDLLSAKGEEFYQIEMDCSNFCADFFEDKRLEPTKFWDILAIARNTDFKNLDDLFTILRKFYDQNSCRTLAIISHGTEKALQKSQVIKTYRKLFSENERKLFTLLTPFIDYPFSFDLQTLSHFYHQSKTFLHVARAERHPRVVSYAWAAGLNVVAPPQVGSLLPVNLQNPPGFLAYNSLEEADRCISNALASSPTKEQKHAYRDFHSSRIQIDRLKSEIHKLFTLRGWSLTDQNWKLNDLDLRLARHQENQFAPNAVGFSLARLAQLLKNPDQIFENSEKDFEKSLLKLAQSQNKDLEQKVSAEMRYLGWFRS